jgi:hypothetical protein
MAKTIKKRPKRQSAAEVLKGKLYLLISGHVFIPLDRNATEAALMLMDDDRFPHTFTPVAIKPYAVCADNGGRIAVEPLEVGPWIAWCGSNALDVPYLRWMQKTFRDKYPNAMAQVDEIAGRYFARDRVVHSEESNFDPYRL